MANARPRQIAYQALRRADAAGDFIEHRLDSDPGFRALSPADRRLAQELVFGVLRQRASLDWVIAARTEGRTQRPEIQDLLRLGLYQLFHLDRVPAHAAVHETVELAREGGFGGQAGFVNAVLRGADRDRVGLLASLEQLKETDPATAWSHPAWLVERWRRRFGPLGLRRMLEWDNTPPPTYARVNTLRTSAAALLERWRAEGVESRPVEKDWFEAGLMHELTNHPPIAALESFRAGDFYVQDPSTLLAARALNAQPGETVLDYCAAPGGKTTVVAQYMQGRGLIVAHDTNIARLRLVTENCARLGVGIVRIASAPSQPGAPGSFDRVLVDAPCSNTGVLRRRLEARWRIRPEELSRLAEAQYRLLVAAARFVKPGGTLVYSTCSLESEENEAVTKAFAESGAGFELREVRQLDPVNHGVDGAYVAVLGRRAA